MDLKELWGRLVAKATEEEAAIAARFEQHIHNLAEEVEALNPFQEYPKWVLGKVVADADEEAKVRAAAEPAPLAPAAPAAAAATAVTEPAAAPAPQAPVAPEVPEEPAASAAHEAAPAATGEAQ